MAIYGTLLEPSDILEAGDLRICTAGRYHRVPDDEIGKKVAEPQIVQVSGGIVTHGHDAFFREGPIDKYPRYRELLEAFTKSADTIRNMIAERQQKDEKIKDLKEQNTLLSEVIRSMRPSPDGPQGHIDPMGAV